MQSAWLAHLNSNAALDIDGLAVYSGYSNVTTGNGEKINMPIIAKEGQSLTHGWPDAVINGILIEGFVVLSAVFAFFAGVQLLSIGFLGEYLGRVHQQIQERPDYIIEKVN